MSLFVRERCVDDEEYRDELTEYSKLEYQDAPFGTCESCGSEEVDLDRDGFCENCSEQIR